MFHYRRWWGISSHTLTHSHVAWTRVCYPLRFPKTQVAVELEPLKCMLNHLKAVKQRWNHSFSSVCQRVFLLLFFYNELDANSFWYLCQQHRCASHNLPDEWLISSHSPLCSNCADWCFRMQVHSLPTSLVLSLKVWHLFILCFFFSSLLTPFFFCVFKEEKLPVSFLWKRSMTGESDKLDVHGWTQIQKFMWPFSTLFCAHVLMMNVIKWKLICMRHILFISNPHALNSKVYLQKKNMGLGVGEGAVNYIRLKIQNNAI